MNFDQQALRDSQRRALKAIAMPYLDAEGTVKNPHYVDGKLTTSPAMLIQELTWANNVNQFAFDFSINGPQHVPGVDNNIVIGKNDVFAMYAITILFGTGTNSASFVYRSHGVLPADDSVYNSIIQIKIESSTFVDKIEGQMFRHNPTNSNEFFGEMGMQLVNPIRILSGELGVFQVNINEKNPLNALVLSANTVVSMRLHGVYGQRK